MPRAELSKGINLHYEKEGDGPPLIFLHGWGFTSAVWQHLGEVFGETHTVYAIDLRGHGQSDKPEQNYVIPEFTDDLLQFMDAVGIAKAIVIGWSMGGVVAMDFAAQYPDRVEKLGVVSSTPKLVRSEDFPYGAPPPIIRRLDKQLSQNFEKAMESFSRLIIYGEDHLKEKRASIWESMENGFTQLPPHVARDCLKMITEADLRPLLGKITVPTVIIHGALDHICPVGAAYYLNSQIPGSMLHIFPTAAHAPHLTHPDQVGVRLAQFLRGEIVD